MAFTQFLREQFALLRKSQNIISSLCQDYSKLCSSLTDLYGDALEVGGADTRGHGVVVDGVAGWKSGNYGRGIQSISIPIQ